MHWSYQWIPPAPSILLWTPARFVASALTAPCRHSTLYQFEYQVGVYLELLEHFTTFSTLGKTSGYRYYSVLKRLSHTGFPGQRAGAVYRKEGDPETSGSLAIPCIACPRPGVNFNIDDVPLEERMFFMFWFSFDGNFRNLRKAKKVDKDDMCFTDGLMYFVAHGLYQEWLKTEANKEPSTDKSRPECDNHKAALDRFVRWAGLDVTGVGACTCARHSSFMPQGLVDFFKGERFAYGDYAIASAIARLLRLGPLEFGMTYDIWCHWSPKFQERATKFPAHLALPSDLKLIGGVPKFHIQGHTEKCRVLHSLNYKSFVGRLEGEGCERAWAFLNETAGSTSEKSPGARWDSINYIILDWNFEKNITMATFLIGKFRGALKSYHGQKAVFTELDQSLPSQLTIHWRKESIEPYKDTNGRWTSPFFGSYDWGQSLQEVLQQENEREEKEEWLAETETTKRGLTRWINKGIDLENTMDKLQYDTSNQKQEGTPRQQNLLNERRERLLSRINAHHQEREQYLGSLETPITKSGSRAPKVEARLQRAVCEDALRTIKNLLGAKHFALQHKRKNAVGEKASTRMEVAMRDLQSKVQRAHRRYNRSCAALLRLDLASTDQETYKLLESNQLRMLSDYLENVSTSLGQKGHAIPWFWRSQAAMNDEQWQIDALKVEWFRARQRYIQWEEELKFLKREMVMALNGFQYERREWESKSLQPGLASGMAEYARQKADFYEQLSVDLYNQCDEHVKRRWFFGSLGKKDGFKEYNSEVNPAGVVTWHYCKQKSDEKQLGGGGDEDKEIEMDWDETPPSKQHRGSPNTTEQSISPGTNKRKRATQQTQAALRGSERLTTPLGSPVRTSRVRFSPPQAELANQSPRSPNKRAVTPYLSPKRQDLLPAHWERELESPTQLDNNDK
ncbi:Transposase family Tnp2 protein [Rhizoctonia solani]|uniref:Transposase family Tnp2 protein n=1 Tax=Rhizoctonia solani TaxID=456999 RepID=A0A8H8P7F4_9AGAM|nr:Transposase family Tnp2 protein [Rhizoctonia solani]QRW25950.1 Transposase family Tnp2 protein [Rhizoctonia solani]